MTWPSPGRGYGLGSVSLLGDVQNRHADFLEAVHDRLASEVKNCPAPSVVQPFVQGGKRLRGLMLFLCGSAVGPRVAETGGAKDTAGLLAAAVSIEMLHAASLVHDDIMDRSTLRRGQPALHRRVGRDGAMLLGDWLLLRATHVLAACHAPPERVRAAVTLLAQYAEECCSGQYRELRGDGTRYDEIVHAKTGAPFAAACALGTVIAGGSQRQVRVCGDFGFALGGAYQVADDLCDGDQRVGGAARWQLRDLALRQIHVARRDLARLPPAPDLRTLCDYVQALVDDA